MYELAGIHVRADGPVRIVTLNRPDELNAFSESFHAEFVHLWEHVDRDEDARAVLLTGAGTAFSAGGSYEDFERRAQLLGLARFKTTAGGGWRSIEE